AHDHPTRHARDVKRGPGERSSPPAGDRSASADAPTRAVVSISRSTGRRPDTAGDRRRSTIRRQNVPQYMLLIFSDPSQGPAEGSPEAMAQWEAWGTYTQGLKDAGVFVSGEPLEAPSTATTVAVRNGDRVVTDGPFAETKE